MESCLSTYLTAIIGVLTALYLYTKWNYNFFKVRGIPGPRPYPLFGTAFAVFKKPFFQLENEWYQSYGKVFGTFEGSRPNLYVADMELLRIITQKEFSHFVDRRTHDLSKILPVMNKTLTNLKGDEWRAARRVQAPSFTTLKLKQMFSIISECSNELVSNCLEFSEKDQVVNIKKIFESVTLNTIALCGFGMKIETLKNPDDPFVQSARDLMSAKPLGVILLLMWPKLLEISNVELIPKSSVDFFKQACTDLIQMRSKESSENMKRKDFLQLMLDARKDDIVETTQEEDGAHTTISQGGEKTYSAKKVLDDEMILAQSIQLLLAGFETTAATLSFAAYSLAANPDIQDRLINEIDDVIGDNEITYELLAEAKLPYLDMVISETLRLYAPAFRIDRVCTEKFSYKNWTIPVGTLISIPIYSIHHDSDYYPEPMKFDPERFTPENKAKRDPLTHIPFGMGPRSCIGMRFALLEVKLVLVETLRKLKFTSCSETEVPQVVYPSTIKTKNEIRLKFEKR